MSSAIPDPSTSSLTPSKLATRKSSSHTVSQQGPAILHHQGLFMHQSHYVATSTTPSAPRSSRSFTRPTIILLPPYQQWQNAAERDIQTILTNMSATIHSHVFLRTDTWSCAAKHWVRLHNSLPHSVNNLTPVQVIAFFHVDTTHQNRHAFGDLLCFPLKDHEHSGSSTSSTSVTKTASKEAT